ncbi:MAG: polyphosphate polymerase domain-containing protein [Clostridia bacterium]|nr:polyphosphate polymerase domain-containing protein [Clostridia bacterium]MBR6966689.1 polyphosphate polymerase domain-containing protein [Clostridia bacterium]
MAGPIVVMKRYELKYLLSADQTDYLVKALEGHMKLDQYGRTSIASLYYDTPNYQLIRTSVEKPLFKEKVRLRSYGLATLESPVYLELKRKAYKIVYKRRVQTTIPLVEKFFAGSGDICAGGQINREITYFRDFYGTLVPACLIIYDREAFFEPGGDLRLTIDYSPRYRTDQLNLTTSMEGKLLCPPGNTILEVKVQEAMPLWLTRILDEGRIYKSSFSKYGTAFRQQLLEARAARQAG